MKSQNDVLTSEASAVSFIFCHYPLGLAEEGELKLLPGVVTGMQVRLLGGSTS